MKHLREGDEVCLIHHMSNKGKILEVYYKPVTSHGTSAGSLSKIMYVRFLSELTGKIVDVRRQDVMCV